MRYPQGHSAKGRLRTWWKRWKGSSVYQIYSASFQDSNGDGVGHLKGIISRVDYIEALGIDIVWLSPIFKSPQIDMGYDASDYRAIHPPYGDISDVDALRDKLYERGMKLVLVLKGTEYYACGLRLHDYLQELGAILKEYDAFSELLNAVGADRGELSMIFHFEFMDLDHGINGKFSPKSLSIDEMKKTLDKWQRLIRAPSAASRANASNHRVASAKLIDIFMMFQAGTPFFPHTSPAHFSPTGQGNTMLYTTVSVSDMVANAGVEKLKITTIATKTFDDAKSLGGDGVDFQLFDTSVV
ncbi:hypothetical protein MY4824_000528 [Beauveria thailandica]